MAVLSIRVIGRLACHQNWHLVTTSRAPAIRVPNTADICVCQKPSIHICGLYPYTIYSSKTKHEQVFRKKKAYPNKCWSLLQRCSWNTGPELPFFWNRVLQFIQASLQSDPATFWLGLENKFSNKLWFQFDSMFAGIIWAYAMSAQYYICKNIGGWCAQGHLFLWLVLNMKQLVLGPKPNIKVKPHKCIGLCYQFLCVWHIASLWDELCQVQIRRLQQSWHFSLDCPDKLNQDIANTDTWTMMHT